MKDEVDIAVILDLSSCAWFLCLALVLGSCTWLLCLVLVLGSCAWIFSLDLVFIALESDAIAVYCLRRQRYLLCAHTNLLIN